jgi:hypothetical protein
MRVIFDSIEMILWYNARIIDDDNNCLQPGSEVILCNIIIIINFAIIILCERDILY